ncbi:MAG: class I SAM-dependent methyltransferase [Terrimicrobiaceae bacterium]
MSLDQHNTEIHENRRSWEKKKSLRFAYAGFYRMIADCLDPDLEGLKLELGSGMGNIKDFIPDCITSDLFPNPWLDRIESAYHLDFADASISHIILFDVWHHLEYPANALAEARRVLVPGGRMIIMDPAMSLLGRLVYGKYHHEPLGFNVPFPEVPVPLESKNGPGYFAAQAAAHRVFLKREIPALLDGWNIESTQRITSFTYLGSGGFRGPQLFPDFAIPFLSVVDRTLGYFPGLFSARMLVVLSKK